MDSCPHWVDSGWLVRALCGIAGALVGFGLVLWLHGKLNGRWRRD